MNDINSINHDEIECLLDQYDHYIELGFRKIIKCTGLISFVADKIRGAYEHFVKGDDYPYAKVSDDEVWNAILKPGFDENKVVELIEFKESHFDWNEKNTQTLYELICQVHLTRKYMLKTFVHYWVFEIQPMMKKLDDRLARSNFSSELNKSEFFKAYGSKFLTEDVDFSQLDRDSLEQFFISFWEDAVRHVHDGRQVIDQLILLNKTFILSHIAKFRTSTTWQIDELFNEVFIHLKFNFAMFNPLKCSLLGFWSVSIKRFLMNLVARKQRDTQSLDDHYIEPSTEPEVVLDTILNLESKELVEAIFSKMKSNEANALERLFGLNGHKKHTIKAVAEMMGKKPNNFRRYDIPRILNAARNSLESSLMN